MFLFQRMVTLRGGIRQPIGWAIEMTEYVNANSDVGIGLWAGRFGMPLGTVVWSARVESRAHLAAVTKTLLAKDDYHALLEKGQEFVAAPGQDSLRQLIHGEGLGATMPPVGSSATLVTATPAPGQLGNAMAWGIEITKMFAGITGATTAFYRDCYGPFGQVTWIIANSDEAGVDAAEASTNARPDYLASVDRAGGFFVPGSGAQALASRIA